MTKIPLKTATLLLTLILSSIPVSVISLENDQQILLNIKTQWNNQTPMNSWNTTIPHCLWHGVICSETGTVSGISLSSQNLLGEIPPSICNLQNLTILDVSNNNINGTFPTFLYKCRKLKVLNISQNFYVGFLPHDINKLSSDIEHIDISGNTFTSDLPSSLGKLERLKTLHFEQNSFNGTFPRELGELERLEELALSFNAFSRMNLPEEFGKLKSLRVLLMSECGLMGEIPRSFGNLSSLERLDLEGNELMGEIPKGLFLLKNLTYLYLYKNRLSGGFPSEIESVNLVELDVSMNYLMAGEIPEAISKLQKLEVLALFDNKFNGTLPLSIARMPSLKKLKIWNNAFYGVLPRDIGLYSKLEGFEVANNAFTGTLPENLCAGGVLMGVVAFNNRLNGTIPSSLGKCKSLLVVQLYNNSMTGEIPEGLWSLSSISAVQVSNNRFSGQLPRKLGVNLTRVEIDNNRFYGKIPQTVGDFWGGLLVFKASNNMISGKIPVELTGLKEINSLQLGNNQLSGELPSEIISWQKLTSLNLSYNRLSGVIPPILGSLPVLSYLDLSSNLLSGEIPSQLGQLTLNSLNLSSNNFAGRIPFRFDNKAYKGSFLSTNLCSDGGVSDLPICSVFREKSKTLSSKYLALVLVLALVAFLATSYYIVFLITEFRRRKHNQDQDDLVTWKLTSFHKLEFTEEKILDNLNESNMIGSGGSGKVYRIPVNGSGQAVAVKRIWNNKKMNSALEKEFLAEVMILGTIRHVNIVKLLCCISSDNSKLLVYEYMKNQSLDQWIHENGTVQRVGLDWPARLKIAIGAAQGLCYMHHDCSPPIIHRDVKSSNILLDSEFNAKIADFGLAKILVKSGGVSDVTSTVAGSFGYMAPEYGYTAKVNEKIDIYSFGVVLLELVTGKEPQIGDENSNLAEWAWKHYNKGNNNVSDILDKTINDLVYVEEMRNVLKLGLMCTSTLPSSRPTMKEVLQVLKSCSVLEGSGRAKNTVNEGDVSPLLDSGYFVSSCKNSKKGDEENDYSMV